MDWSSNVLSYLAGVAVRSLLLALIAGAVLIVFRVRSAAVRHAVWTIVVAGMLALGILTPLLPELPWRVLNAKPAAAPSQIDPPAVARTSPTPSPRPPAPLSFRVEDGALLLYATVGLFLLTRLAFSYAFTVRLVRASRRLEGVDLYESTWISVPLTVGWFRPKILLPAGWEQWDRAKLDAVLAHERTHVRRGDWAVSVLTGMNRSIFWFHPLAWWLERRLASLAEQACDDAALLEVGTESYAQALLDMAAAVKTGNGRMVWEAMAMAKASEVRMRIERILDETRQIPKALTKLRWIAIVGSALPLIYVAAVVKPVPVAAQQTAAPPAVPTPAPPPPSTTGKKGARKPPSADEVPALEQQLATNPDDPETRRNLAEYYLRAGMSQQAITHITWLINNHPESVWAEVASMALPLNDPEYPRVATLWNQQAAAHRNDEPVVVNAAAFTTRPGGDLERAEKILLSGQSGVPSANVSHALGRVYGLAILSTSGDPSFPNTNPAFAQRAKSLVQGSSDRALTQMAALTIQREASLQGSDHPLLAPLADWAKTLLPPQPEISNIQPVTRVDPVYPPLAKQARISGNVNLTITVDATGHVAHITVVSGHPLLVPAALEAVKQWTYSPGNAGTFTIAVPFRLDGSDLAQPPGSVPPTVANSFPPSADGTPRIKIGGAVQQAKLVTQVHPEYPPLASQIRLSGVVHLHVLIGTDGHVKLAEVISGHPLFVQPAVSAVQQWVYAPTTLNGQPVEVDTTVDVNFTLNQ